MVEDFLTHLAGCGFDYTHLVGAYRGPSSFLLGQLLLEAASRGADTAPVEGPVR